MAFSEELKLSVKRRAHFGCCLCHELFVEIHHILPQSEGGPDTEPHAAPLCPSCHETYGANPEKRKFIREVRDFWYELCEKRYPSTGESIKSALAEALKNVATKEDLEQMSVRNTSLLLGSTSNEGKIALDRLRYSFVREEYIHPRILQELRGWISDRDSTVVGIDLGSANRSNRFYGDIQLSESRGRLWVIWAGENERFGYSYIATSPSGVHMVECSDWGGAAAFSIRSCY
jgi:HNH endonuclease